MSKILIIEDDNNILQLEKDYLEANGFEVEAVSDGEEGLNLSITKDFDLILLDVMLPNTDGFEICQKVRAEKNTPIIFVSAKKEEPDKINGLSFGADDYIVKPFSPGELVARVRAHIGRYQRLTDNVQADRNMIVIDNLRLDKVNRLAYLDDKEIILTKKEFDVLYILASNPKTVFSKNELFETVWGYDSLGDTSTLTVHINRLREKFKEVCPDSNYIRTVWGRGYKFK